MRQLRDLAGKNIAYDDLLASFGIYQITSGAISEPYVPPWSAIIIAVTCVFMIVFITMFYAVTKLRKDNPIDAIRMENN